MTQVLLPGIYLASISLLDLRTRRIPNKLILFVTGLAILTNGYQAGIDGILVSFLGFLLGGSLLLLPFLLSGMGGGDVKAMAALGALLGPPAIFQTFLYTALIGGGMAILFYSLAHDLREKSRAGLMALGAFVVSKDVRCLVPEPPKKKHKFPYAPAIALGYLAYLAWGNLV